MNMPRLTSCGMRALLSDGTKRGKTQVHVTGQLAAAEVPEYGGEG